MLGGCAYAIAAEGRCGHAVTVENRVRRGTGMDTSALLPQAPEVNEDVEGVDEDVAAVEEELRALIPSTNASLLQPIRRTRLIPYIL